MVLPYKVDAEARMGAPTLTRKGIFAKKPAVLDLWQWLGRGGGGGRREQEAVGVSVEVFKVFLLGQVLQHLAEQIIEDVDEEEIFKVFSQDWVSRVQQRFVEQNCDAWVWWRRSPT